jgi:hypothetical protein
MGSAGTWPPSRRLRQAGEAAYWGTKWGTVPHGVQPEGQLLMLLAMDEIAEYAALTPDVDISLS